MSSSKTDLRFDYVIVGGGSAGAIIARRLADAQIGSVALIEAGPKDEGVPCLMDISRLFEQPSSLDWGFGASKLDGDPASLKYSRAKVLGGCGNHNDCAWLVPPDSDFASWERQGAAGWGPEAMRSATTSLLNQVVVETPSCENPVSLAFLASGRELGLPLGRFIERIAPGIGMLPLNAIGKNRQSSSVAYLHPLDSLPGNLTLMTDTFVSRVVVKKGRAIGCDSSVGFIAADAEVILCAGSVQSPQLLMVSGIGPGHKLASLGIALVTDLPGVGQNLLDHYSSSVVFEMKQRVAKPKVTPYEAIALLKIDSQAPAPDCMLQLGLTTVNPNGRLDADFAGQPSLVTVAVNATRPKSSGTLELVTGDLRDAPDIQLNFLSDKDGYDLRIMREGFKFARRFMTTSTFQELALREVGPGPALVNDEEIEQYFRSTNLETLYHPVGTCKMGRADDAMGVVGPNLKVKNVGALRVCDAAVFPSMITVNINCSVMIVAERAAELIIADARQR